MSATPELRDRLRSLSISKEQRPSGPAVQRRGGLGKWIVLLIVIGGGYAGWQYWPELSPRLQQVMVATASATTGSGGEPELRTMTVRPRADSQAPPLLTATGKIVSDHRVQVVTKVSGQIVELRFEQGDRVKEGQVLARIEDVNYRALRDQAAALRERAKATLEFENYNLKRITGLYEQGRMTDTEIAVARRTHDETAAQLLAAEASLTYAQKALTDTEVVAPISGVILERNVEIGDFVAAEGGRGANANAQFATIADMTKLRVEVDISELDINKIRPDMPCLVTPDAYKDRHFNGHVMWIDPGANYAKGTVQAKVRIDDPDDGLRVEGSAQVSFLAEAPSSTPAAPTIWIPLTAVLAGQAGGSDAHVFVVENGRVREQRITTGRKVGSLVEVTDGLRDGDTIAVERLDELQDGKRVRLPKGVGTDSSTKN